MKYSEGLRPQFARVHRPLRRRPSGRRSEKPIPFTRVRHLLALLSVGVVASLAAPQPATAAQEEPAAQCSEGIVPEPIPIAYGAHTEGCAIEAAGDTDSFDWTGAAGDLVRINVLGVQMVGFDVHLEVFELATNTKIVDRSCFSGPTDHCSLYGKDFALPAAGAYRAVISDVGLNDTSAYLLAIECFLGACAEPAPLTYDSPVSDSIAPTVDLDGYQFHGEAGTKIQLRAYGDSGNVADGFDTRLDVVDPNGIVTSPFCSSPGGRSGCGLFVPLDLILTGPYRAYVSDNGAGESGDYSLDLQCVFGPCDSDADGVPDPFTPIAYDFPTTGTISPGTDHDGYEIHGEAGTKIRVNVNGNGFDFDTRLDLVDPSGGVSTFDCNGGSSGCTLSQDFDLGLTGTYRLFVSERSLNATSGFWANVQCLFGPCDSDGDGVPDAVEEIPYDLPTSRSVSPNTDVVGHEFHGDSGTRIRIDARGTASSFDTRLDVVDPNGLLSTFACTGGPNGCSISRDLDLGVTGTYRLFLSDFQGNDASPISVNLQCLFGHCDSDGDGVADSVEFIVYGSPESPVIDPVMDIEAFDFGGEAGSRVNLNADCTGQNFDTRLEVVDPNGAVASSSCAGGQGGCSVSLEADVLTNGTHRVLISDVGSNETSSCTLTLSCVAGTCPQGPPLQPPFDNCRGEGNGPLAGTCTVSSVVDHVPGQNGLLDRARYGTPCVEDLDCGAGGFCSLAQDNADGDPFGDACDAACDDGRDNDLDGFTDASADEGCGDVDSMLENPQCSDGIDNDDRGDVDGADPNCLEKPWKNTERSPKRCGLGFELALVLAPLGWMRGRARKRAS